MSDQSVNKVFSGTGNTDVIHIKRGEHVDYAITGTFDATLALQREMKGGAGWETLMTFTTAASGQWRVDDRYANRNYRIACTAYTSGSPDCTISDSDKTLQSLKGSHGATAFEVSDDGVETIRLDGTDRAAELDEAIKPQVKPYFLNLYDFKKTGAMKDALADTPGANLLGLGDAAGAVLTGTQTNGGSTASATESASIEWALPAEYQAGQAITLRVRAKVTALQEVADTVDAVVKKKGADGTLGSDICATAAQDLTTDYADYDFTITPTGLVAGDILNIQVTLATDDEGGTQNGTPTISQVSLRPVVLT